MSSNNVPAGLLRVNVSQGLSAYQLAKANDPSIGTVDEWLASLQGADGLSAYQVAVNNGFVGTADEWLNSLSGSRYPYVSQTGGYAGADTVAFSYMNGNLFAYVNSNGGASYFQLSNQSAGGGGGDGDFLLPHYDPFAYNYHSPLAGRVAADIDNYGYVTGFYTGMPAGPPVHTPFPHGNNGGFLLPFLDPYTYETWMPPIGLVAAELDVYGYVTGFYAGTGGVPAYTSIPSGSGTPSTDTSFIASDLTKSTWSSPSITGETIASPFDLGFYNTFVGFNYFNYGTTRVVTGIGNSATNDRSLIYGYKNSTGNSDAIVIGFDNHVGDTFGAGGNYCALLGNGMYAYGESGRMAMRYGTPGDQTSWRVRGDSDGLIAFSIPSRDSILAANTMDDTWATFGNEENGTLPRRMGGITVNADQTQLYIWYVTPTGLVKKATLTLA